LNSFIYSLIFSQHHKVKAENKWKQNSIAGRDETPAVKQRSFFCKKASL
jgi:hypothetical protein